MKAFLRKARGGQQPNGTADVTAPPSPPQESAPSTGRTKVQAKPTKGLKIITDGPESEYRNHNEEKSLPPTPATTKSSSSEEDDHVDNSDGDDDKDGDSARHASLSNATAVATPLVLRKADSTMTPAPILRTDADLRSPGAKATPMNAPAENTEVDDNDDSRSLPSFITQTDKDGKSLSVRPPVPPANANGANTVTTLARPRGKEETLLESLRTMCCCLSLDESPTAMKKIAANKVPSLNSPKASTEPTPVVSADTSNQTQVKAIEDESPYDFVLPPTETKKKCLVLDLDETLVHSSFRPVPTAHFILPVQVDSVMHSVYVAKRPGAEDFLCDMAKHFEVVVYTASLNKYADPLLDLLDPTKTWVTHRLFREHCTYHEGHYVKDLGKLNRSLETTILVDNSPNSYLFHPQNAIDCSSFIDDMNDRELEQIGSFLKGIAHTKDVRKYCSKWREWPNLPLEEEEEEEEALSETVDLMDDFAVEAKDGSVIHSLD